MVAANSWSAEARLGDIALRKTRSHAGLWPNIARSHDDEAMRGENRKEVAVSR